MKIKINDEIYKIWKELDEDNYPLVVLDIINEVFIPCGVPKRLEQMRQLQKLVEIIKNPLLEQNVEDQDFFAKRFYALILTMCYKFESDIKELEETMSDDQKKTYIDKHT